MSLEADIRRDTNPTPTRFLLDCEEMSSGFGLNLDNPYSPFDASYKFLNPGTPRSDDPIDTDLKTSTSTVAMLSQHQHFLSEQHPWSDIMFEEACMPLRQMSPGISPPSSSSSSSSSSDSDPFRSRMSSMNSDYLISHPEATHARTHEYNALFDKLVPSKKSYHSDLDLPSLAPDSPTPESLVPSDTLRHSNNASSNTKNQHNSSDNNNDIKSNSSMTRARQGDIYRQADLQSSLDHEDDQDMSDHNESGMDVDSNESNDEGEEESGSSKDSFGSRESSMSEGLPTKTRPTRAAARAATKAAKSKSAKSSAKAKKNAMASAGSKMPASRKSKGGSTTKTNATRASSTGSKSSTSSGNSSNGSSSGQSRKHSSNSEEESPEAKRQKFLERNRMAASKCREKKRLQTLKTIADADAITARNQALHESLDELQEEVRSLKNQILCHRDCGCDVIQKFVQSSFGVAPSTSFMTGPSHGQMSARSQVQLC